MADVDADDSHSQTTGLNISHLCVRKGDSENSFFPINYFKPKRWWRVHPNIDSSAFGPIAMIPEASLISLSLILLSLFLSTPLENPLPTPH
jgi:hypothetical protein